MLAWALSAVVVSGIAFGGAFLPGVAYASQSAAAVSPPPAGAFQLHTQSAPVQLTMQKAKAKTGWVKTKAGKAYCRKGAKVTGLQKIGSTYRYFSKKGVLRTSDVRIGTTTFYIDAKGRVIGARCKGSYYYRTLKKMTATDAQRFGAYLQARKVVAAVTTQGDSKGAKLRKVYDWAADRPYVSRGKPNYQDVNWVARCAAVCFDKKNGDCHNAAAALGYLMKCIGYNPRLCVRDHGDDTHAWIMLGDKVYDVGFARHVWFGTPLAQTSLSATFTQAIPWFSPSNAASKAKVPSALLQAGKAGISKGGSGFYYYEKGEKVRSAWRTVDGKRYYFTKSGRAATGSVKVAGVYYVFDKNGVLQRDAKAGVRVVKVSGKAYRIDGKGRAVAGWSAGKTRYYAANGALVVNAQRTIGGKVYRFGKSGALLKGTWVVDGAFYVAGDDGVRIDGQTATLNAAAKNGAKATGLRRLLGAPREESYQSSCDFDGDNGLWIYDRFIVMTARPVETWERYRTIDDAIAAEDAGTLVAPYETIVAVEEV